MSTDLIDVADEVYSRLPDGSYRMVKDSKGTHPAADAVFTRSEMLARVGRIGCLVYLGDRGWSERKPAMGSLFAALAAATAAADAVGKRATMNMGQGKTGYKYASSEDVITEAREALSSCGLALYCRSASVRPLGTSQVEGGDGVVSTSTQWEAHLVYVLVHSSGESLEIESATPIMPGNGRPMDKALATAKTYDLAYTLRTLLLLPRLDPREIAEEPVDQRRDGPAPAATNGTASTEGAEIIASLRTCDASQLVDLTRRAMRYFTTLPQDSAERTAGRDALAAAQKRLA